MSQYSEKYIPHRRPPCGHHRRPQIPPDDAGDGEEQFSIVLLPAPSPDPFPCIMVDKLTIVICHYGGHFSAKHDGSVQYMGGDAKAFDVRNSTTVEEIQSEIAAEMKCDPRTLKLRYFLPGDNRTPLNIVFDKDLQRMVGFHGDARTIHIYVLSDDNVERSLVIDSRANKAVLGDSTSTAGPSSPPDKFSGEKKVAALVSTPVGNEVRNAPNNDWDKGIIGVGQEFKSVKDFRSTLGKFAIATGFRFFFLKNDPNRVTAKCKSENCNWRIHASKLAKTPIFKIKKYESSHTCEGVNAVRHPQATRHWVGDVIKNMLIESPHLKPRDIINDLQRDYGVELRYHQAWRGIEVAKESLKGLPFKEYDDLPQICRMIMKTNPGSHTALATTEESRFKRLFICFYASKIGFNDACRPLIFLNQTSLMDRHQEILLSATSVDADDGMFPLAFAIVDGEDEPNWNWFLSELKQVVNVNQRITFITNREKELIKAVPEVFPDSYHGFCMNNLCQCFKYEVRGGFSAEVTDYMIRHLWRAAYAPTILEFDKEILEIRKISENAVSWVHQSRPDYWSNAYFEGERYNHMTSDVSNLFNQWVLEVKDLPIAKIVHEIRCKIMELIYARHLDSEKWDTRFAPSVEQYMKRDMLESHTKQILCSSSDQFEVSDDVIRRVSMHSYTCTCKQWQIQGRPCPHALVVLNRFGRNPYDFCNHYLSAEMYRLAYSNPVNPNPVQGDEELALEDEEKTPVHPPLVKRKPGRPRKKKPEPVVEGRNFHCSACGGAKHNKRTCKELTRNLLENVQNTVPLDVNLCDVTLPSI